MLNTIGIIASILVAITVIGGIPLSIYLWLNKRFTKLGEQTTNVEKKLITFVENQSETLRTALEPMHVHIATLEQEVERLEQETTTNTQRLTEQTEIIQRQSTLIDRIIGLIEKS